MMPQAGSLDATVLICTYNRASLLAETLDSLTRCRVSTLRWNVIVVDNNSTDATRQVVVVADSRNTRSSSRTSSSRVRGSPTR